MPFHSVMYAAEDAGIPQQGWCGVNGETTRWMQQLVFASERARNTEFKPPKTVLVQLLLNTGSQRSFIRQDVSRDLKFPVRDAERLTLFTFGQMKRPATFTCERVALTLRSKHGSNENTIEALAIPEISPVTSPPADGEIVTMMTRKEILPAGARPDAMTFREDDSSKAKRHSGDHLERWIGRRPLEHQEQSEGSYYDGDVYDDGDVDDMQAGKGYTDRRRQSKAGGRPRRTYRVCGLYVHIDHLLYRQFAKIDNDAVRTRERLSTLIAGLTARASDIFRHTDFSGVEDVSCPSRKNPFCLDKMDPSLFLLTAAKSANYDEYCLAYTWTYRDFDSGVLGLAYVGNSTTHSLGVCDKNRLLPEDPTQPQLGLTRLSLNTGMITFLNYNAYVAQAVSEITFSHEIGHNFGSPHDTPDGSPCAPGNKKNGNYIMYFMASSGLEPNNRLFSTCSRGNISEVIKPMVEGKSPRENCFQGKLVSLNVFKQESGPVCGNGIVEGVEECDCGYSEAECHDPCCYARRNSVNAKGCTLRPGKQCSPTTGPCCDKDCKLVPTTTMCAPETECREKAMCTYPFCELAPIKFTEVILQFNLPNVV
ncbi:hypothetical protein HPB51_027048 [Rhipicephalus microplus]|uniref:Disintegrin and metalloproteinase domain-containing protein 10 n=1 Tax=Rhipicephalus microplus TaxID=6941 RepID=A0A9J6D1C1_RHIMP|nr:hypothetical protein HPB51_027048 [Rhipicephalus microplus]